MFYKYSLLPSSGDLMSFYLNHPVVHLHLQSELLLVSEAGLGWRVALKFWQEMCRTALGPPELPVRPLLHVFSSFSSLYHLWSTSHICQNRSIEFKQMSEGQTALPRASALFSLMRHFVYVWLVCVWFMCVYVMTQPCWLLHSLLVSAGGKTFKGPLFSLSLLLSVCSFSCCVAPPCLFSLFHPLLSRLLARSLFTPDLLFLFFSPPSSLWFLFFVLSFFLFLTLSFVSSDSFRPILFLT